MRLTRLKCEMVFIRCMYILFSMGIKVPAVVDIAKKALAENQCVVIGLQTTGEVSTATFATNAYGE